MIVYPFSSFAKWLLRAVMFDIPILVDKMLNLRQESGDHDPLQRMLTYWFKNTNVHNCPPCVMKVNIFCLSTRWFHSDYFLTLCMREFHRFLRKNLKKIVKNHVCCVLFCFVFFFWAYFGISSWLRNRLMQVQPHVRNRQWYQKCCQINRNFWTENNSLSC